MTEEEIRMEEAPLIKLHQAKIYLETAIDCFKAVSHNSLVSEKTQERAQRVADAIGIDVREIDVMVKEAREYEPEEDDD